MMGADKPPQCPICGKASQEKTKPFCSQRCANVDLGRWFGESYRLPDIAGEEEESLPSDDGEEF